MLFLLNFLLNSFQCYHLFQWYYSIFIYIHQKSRQNPCYLFHLPFTCYSLSSPISFIPIYQDCLCLSISTATIFVQGLIMSYFDYLNCFLTGHLYIDSGFLPIHIFSQMIFAKQSLQHVTCIPHSLHLVKTLRNLPLLIGEKSKSLKWSAWSDLSLRARTKVGKDKHLECKNKRECLNSEQSKNRVSTKK